LLAQALQKQHNARFLVHVFSGATITIYSLLSQMRSKRREMPFFTVSFMNTHTDVASLVVVVVVVVVVVE